MALEAMLCLAFDRKPVSGPIDHSLAGNALGFHEVMLCYYNLVHEWQDISSRTSNTLLSVQVIEDFNMKIEDICRLARQFSSTSAGTRGIEHRIRTLFLELHRDTFHASILRAGAMAMNSTPDYRVVCLKQCQTKLREVIRGFLAMKELTPIALRSWPILSCVSNAAMLLARFGESDISGTKLGVDELLQSLQTEAGDSWQDFALDLAPLQDTLLRPLT